METSGKDLFLRKCRELLDCFESEVDMFVRGQQMIIRRSLLELLQQETFSALMKKVKTELQHCHAFWKSQAEKCPRRDTNKRRLLRKITGKINFILKLLNQHAEELIIKLSAREIIDLRKQIATILMILGENIEKVEILSWRTNPTIVRPEDSGVFDLLQELRKIPKTPITRNNSGRLAKKKARKEQEIKWERDRQELERSKKKRQQLKASRRLPALDPDKK